MARRQRISNHEGGGGRATQWWNRFLDARLQLPLILLVCAGLYYGHTVGSNYTSYSDMLLAPLLSNNSDETNDETKSNDNNLEQLQQHVRTLEKKLQQKQEQVEDLTSANTQLNQRLQAKADPVRVAFNEQNAQTEADTMNADPVAEKNSQTQAEEIPSTEEAPNNKQQHREREKEEPLNIVLFYADDWTMKVMGKLNPQVETPNIDRMADQGVLFSNNCVTTSVCWISRATLMTGVYSAVHRETEPPSHNMFTTNPWKQTLFPLLKQAGYYTGLVGKWHAPQPEEYMPMTFDYSNFYFGWHWMERDGKERHVTDLNREDALDFLQNRPPAQKFALKVSFFATHALDGEYPSYRPMNESKANLYNNVNIDAPKTATDKHFMELPFFFRDGNNEGRNRWRKRFEPEYYQDNIKDLYRMATEVDAVVGDVIEELKRQGVYNNTLLIFTTDNGNLHGEHGLAEKWFPFEESIRVPLVIQDPRMAPEVRGTVNTDWTLNVDLPPTLLGAAQVPPSAFMQGRDIADLYLNGKEDDDTKEWRQDFFYEFNTGDPFTAEGHAGKFWLDASFALVTKEWKYIYWPQHEYEQLFHRSLDPYDEWDLMHHPNVTQIQTTDEIYQQMKTRYAFLKNWAQSGNQV